MKEAITEAILDRLGDLEAAARRLRQVIGAGDPPGMLLARAAVDIDQAAGVLAAHAERLAGGKATDADARPPQSAAENHP